MNRCRIEVFLAGLWLNKRCSARFAVASHMPKKKWGWNRCTIGVGFFSQEAPRSERVSYGDGSLCIKYDIYHMYDIFDVYLLWVKYLLSITRYSMIVLIGNEKGGVGKSTIARNLAVACKLAGHDVAVIDADKQGSLSLWLETRKENDTLPFIPGVKLVGRCGKDIVAMSQKYQTLIVDVAGRDSVELREAAIVSDLWLVPTSVDPDDTDALVTAMTIVRNTELAAGIKPNARMLLNKCSTSIFEQDANNLIDVVNTEEGRDLNDTMPPMASRISNRKAFPKSRECGQGVIEYAQRKGAGKSDQLAAAEIIGLYEEVFGQAFVMEAASK